MQNRELKFRVWSKRQNKYLKDGNFGIFSGNEILWNGGDDEDAGTYDDYTIQQFTGLNDKLGRPIYEGDILNFSDEGKYLVIWSDVQAGFIFSDGMRIGKSDVSYSRVVGNIYENPELLNESARTTEEVKVN